MLPPRGGCRPHPAGASGWWGRRERGRFERTGVRDRAGAVEVRAAPGQGGSVDVAGVAKSRSDSRGAGLASSRGRAAFAARVGVPHDPCADCGRSLEVLLLRAVCPRCAVPLPADAADAPALADSAPPPCVACLNQPPPFDRVVAPWSFAPPLSSLIRRMKYRRELAVATALGRLLAREVTSAPGLHDARRGDWTAHLPAAAPHPRIQPRGRTGRHRPRGAWAPAAARGPHRPPPHAASSQARSAAERHANVRGRSPFAVGRRIFGGSRSWTMS